MTNLIFLMCPKKEEWDKFLLKVDEFMDKKSSGSKGMAWNFNTKSGSSSVIELTNINENTVSTIGQIINNQPSLFILLRHFAWLPWRQHVKQIEDNQVLTSKVN